MANAARERRRRRRIALAVSGPAAALLAAAGPAWAGPNRPTISISGDLYSRGVAVWTINRSLASIASIDCTLNGEPWGCGSISSGQLLSSKSSKFIESFPLLCGDYPETYVVKVTLTDHETVSGSATIGVIPLSGCPVVSPSGIFPSGVNM
jgi:hypothetical protein